MKNHNTGERPFGRSAIRVATLAALAVGMLLVAGCNMATGPLASNADGSTDILASGRGHDSNDTSSTSDGTSLDIFGAASTFGVLAGTTVTSAGETVITGDLGVSPGTAITGFQPTPINTIMGPGTVTPGLGIVDGTIYAAGPIAASAHNDAVLAYDYLMAQVPDTTYAGVTQLDGLTITPGVYRFAPSANLQVNGILTLDFQGNSDALFIFQSDSTVVTMAGSQVVAINTSDTTCSGSNVYWAVGSSATVDGDQFIGSIVAYTTITMTPGGAVSGRVIALNGAVTMIGNTIAVCEGSTTGGGNGNGNGDGDKGSKGSKGSHDRGSKGSHDRGSKGSDDRGSRGSKGSDDRGSRGSKGSGDQDSFDRVTGGGWIDGTDNNGRGHRRDRATFGVSGGITTGDEFWGQLSFDDHNRTDRVKIKSTSVTGYTVIDAETRQIDGIARVNGRHGETVTYTVIVVDNGERGSNDTFSLVLSNGYTASGTLEGGNIQLHTQDANE